MSVPMAAAVWVLICPSLSFLPWGDRRAWRDFVLRACVGRHMPWGPLAGTAKSKGIPAPTPLHGMLEPRLKRETPGVNWSMLEWMTCTCQPQFPWRSTPSLVPSDWLILEQTLAMMPYPYPWVDWLNSWNKAGQSQVLFAGSNCRI